MHLVLHDVPIPYAGFFEIIKNLLPLHVALADKRLRVALGMLLDMNGSARLGYFFRKTTGSRTHLQGVANIELHDDFLACLAKERVPRQFAFELLELDRVIEITHAHAVGLDLLRRLVKYLCHLPPALLRLSPLWRDTEDDQQLVPQSLVEFDGFADRKDEPRNEHSGDLIGLG